MGMKCEGQTFTFCRVILEQIACSNSCSQYFWACKTQISGFPKVAASVGLWQLYKGTDNLGVRKWRWNGEWMSVLPANPIFLGIRDQKVALLAGLWAECAQEGQQCSRAGRRDLQWHSRDLRSLTSHKLPFICALPIELKQSPFLHRGAGEEGMPDLISDLIELWVLQGPLLHLRNGPELWLRSPRWNHASGSFSCYLNQ